MPVATAPKKTRVAEGDRGAHGEAHLLVGPGDRVEDRDDDGEQGQRDHDQQERQVAEARSALAATLIAM